LIYNVAGNLIAPLVNKRAIQAEYMNANAKQLQTIYNYQRVIINAVTEVVTRVAKVENYGNSIEIKKQQVQSLEAAVSAATSLYMNPRAELPIDYLDVLTAQNELFDAIRDLIDTKGEQLFAIVNTYQALGGGAYLVPILHPQPFPYEHKWLHLILSDMHPPTVPIPPGGGPLPPPPPPAAPESGLAQPPPPPAAPERGLAPPPTSPAAERVPGPLSMPPAAERLPEAIPAPGSGTGSGGGKAAGTVPNGDAPPP
jgi:hypothetical protein